MQAMLCTPRVPAEGRGALRPPVRLRHCWRWVGRGCLPWGAGCCVLWQRQGSLKTKVVVWGGVCQDSNLSLAIILRLFGEFAGISCFALRALSLSTKGNLFCWENGFLLLIYFCLHNEANKEAQFSASTGSSFCGSLRETARTLCTSRNHLSHAIWSQWFWPCCLQ